jgi:hypothetical protein
VETRWRVAASAGAFRSALRFDGVRTGIAERTVVATLGRQLGARVALEVGAGAILDGTLTPSGGEQVDVDVGPAATVALSWLALPETARRPFLFLAASLAASTTTAGGARLTALDARVSLLGGKTVFQRLTLYGAARGFGGPVRWRLGGERVVGADVHHYSLGAGARVVLPAGVDLFVEGMALGEASVSAGAGLRF